jgi:ATP-dependent protease ClpP protease subunit
MANKPDLNFRPNPARAVYITREINDELCRKLLPQINDLRLNQDLPLTIYINSPGGSIRVLEVLMGMLKGPDLDGVEPRIITVVAGDAASAAAMLLARGDYAIAFPHSIIHCHGIRYSEISDLTTEKASSFAKHLEASNREMALEVANKSIRRLAHRYVQVSDEELQKLAGQAKLDIPGYLDRIKPNLSELAWKAAQFSSERTRQVFDISAEVLGPLNFDQSDSRLQMDFKVFRALIDYEEKHSLCDRLTLDEESVAKLVDDYFLIRDYYWGAHSDFIQGICEIYGPLFLGEEEYTEYQALESSQPENVNDWMYEKVAARLKPFWYFTVVLCRRLHEGENRLSAEDAYWLGLVDEVVGTPMTGYRSIIESQSEISSSSES